VSVEVRLTDPEQEKETIMKKWMQMMWVAGAAVMFAGAAKAADGTGSSDILGPEATVEPSALAKAQVNLDLAGFWDRVEAVRVNGWSNGCANVSIRVFNTGTRDLVTPAFLTLYVNPGTTPGCGRVGVARQPLGIIRARSSRWYTFTSIPLSMGSCTLWGLADSSCAVSESEENDNLQCWPYYFFSSSPE
jgi:hypothetical protein